MLIRNLSDFRKEGSKVDRPTYSCTTQGTQHVIKSSHFGKTTFQQLNLKYHIRKISMEYKKTIYVQHCPNG